MTRCQHCNKLTHSHHLNVYVNSNDMDKVVELQSLIDWTTAYMYANKSTDPREYGTLKCGDIILHFICLLESQRIQ